MPSGGVTLKRRCTYRLSVIYLIVNKLLSLSLSRRSVWDPETSKEWIGDRGGPETVWALLCVAERRATRPNGEWGYSTRRHMLGPERPEAALLDRALYYCTYRPPVISLSRSLALSLSLSLSRARLIVHGTTHWRLDDTQGQNGLDYPAVLCFL